jgi:hypothetical protein
VTCPSCLQNDRIITGNMSLPMNGDDVPDGRSAWINGVISDGRVLLFLFPHRTNKPRPTDQYDLLDLGLVCPVGHSFYWVTDRE